MKVKAVSALRSERGLRRVSGAEPQVDCGSRRDHSGLKVRRRRRLAKKGGQLLVITTVTHLITEGLPLELTKIIFTISIRRPSFVTSLQLHCYQRFGELK